MNNIHKRYNAEKYHLSSFLKKIRVLNDTILAAHISNRRFLWGFPRFLYHSKDITPHLVRCTADFPCTCFFLFPVFFERGIIVLVEDLFSLVTPMTSSVETCVYIGLPASLARERCSIPEYTWDTRPVFISGARSTRVYAHIRVHGRIVARPHSR